MKHAIDRSRPGGAAPPAAPGRARLYMLGAVAAQSLYWALARDLSADYAPMMIVFFRNLFGLVAVIPFFVTRGTGLLATRRPGLHGVRAGVSLGGAYLLFLAIASAPLATVVSITYAAPVLAVAGAAVLFKEKLRTRRTLAIAAGFVGVLIVVRPGTAPISAGIAAALGAAIAQASAVLLVKALSRTESDETIVAYTFVFATPLSLALAAPSWSWPSPADLAAFALIGAAVMLSQLCLVRAFRGGDVGAVLPLDFLRLVAAAVIGAAVFSERPDAWVWIGGAFILGASVYNATDRA